ncbi:MAG: YlbF family regulator [Firmicutes bacterium]|nr:YlbF family regulator [Bacillota bacterium]
MRMKEELARKIGELAEALRQTDEYKRLAATREEVEKREAAKLMLEDIQRKQAALQKAAAEGKDVKELEESFRQSVTVANYNPYVRELMEAELVFADLFFRVEAALAQALAKDPPPAKSSRLWVPGRGSSDS